MATITTEMDGAVAVVTLAKPPHNLIEGTMMNEIVAAYEGAKKNRARALILRSAQRHFCAGADLAYFVNSTFQSNRREWEDFMSAVENIEIPTVAAVNGGALGGGIEMALTCDFIIAADNAFLGQVEVGVGLLPLLGGTQRLTARCGPARAKEIAMFGRRHTAQTLERWNVVNLVVPEAELMTSALAWARQLAAGPSVALAGIKIQANEAARGGVAAADARQMELNDRIWKSKDRDRGYAAFKATGPGTAVYEGD